MASPEMDLTRIGHVGIVVKDLRAAMESYWHVLGIGPWRVRTSGDNRTTHRGKPNSYLSRVGVAVMDGMVVELIRPLRGENSCVDFLKERGEGVQHIGVYVPNLDEALARLAEHGIPVLETKDETGATRDGRVAYLDTRSMLGVILELIQPATERVVDEVYPASPRP